MIVANVGEDDSSSAGDSDSSGSSGSSSGNSGLIRNHGGQAPTPSAAGRTRDQAKRRHSQQAADAAGKPKPRGEVKTARKLKLQPLTTNQDAKPLKKKSAAMTRQFSGYGTLKSAKSEPPSDESSATSWKSNVEKWSLDAHQLLSPRGGARIKKQFNGPSRSAAARAKATSKISEESGDDSETSTSSFSSSYSSDSPWLFRSARRLSRPRIGGSLRCW